MMGDQNNSISEDQSDDTSRNSVHINEVSSVSGRGGQNTAIGVKIVREDKTKIYQPFSFSGCHSPKAWLITIIVVVLVIAGASIGGIFASKDSKKGSAETPVNPQPTSPVVNTSTSHGNETGTFDSTKYRAWDEPQPLLAEWVRFGQSFAAPPKIALGLQHLNAKEGSSTAGVSVYADGVTESGFVMHLDAVADSEIYTAVCTWIAAPPYSAVNTTQYQVGHWSTLESHPRGQTQAETSSRISFGYKFDVAPHVVLWIDGFEMASARDWRLKTYATDIDLTGFTIHIDTWNDTILYVGNASWVAWPASTPNVVTGVMEPAHVHDLGLVGVNYTFGDRVHVDWPQDVKTGNIPTVLSGFGSFDVDNNSWMRFSELYGTPNTTADGMDRDISGFQQARFRDGSVPYIAAFA
ncbi:uncharacterized protein PV07_05703 [Cladophialophora immunda]|uniref:H-type lectin domain-containing protein n=1 Tax=Cladophialophora immunda TaxID=569365 RepID=A0A0D2CFN1_9EURO|nr:uncharacterized protein PV07_05703 [Cladophialophora immunda]KIW29918.1 hypothetical protein PV07_05703 [Cladophialophora immunda]